MDSSAPLDAHRVWFHMIHLHGRLSAAFSKRLREINLSIPQCDVLIVLNEREGLSQQDIAMRLEVTKGNISGLIDRLEASGLVERRSLKGDRRTHALYMTSTGRRLANEGIAAQRAFVAETLGRLSPTELAQLRTLFEQINNILRKAEASRDGEESQAG